MTSRAPAPEAHPATGTDIARQAVVIAALCFMLVASLVNSGVFGGPSVDELQDGALSDSSSYLAPAGPAFSIWSVIYAGLAAYAIWQALPGRRADPRQRVVGWLIAGTMVLNGLWLVVARFGSLGATVVSIVALLVLLGVTFQRLVATTAQGWVEVLLVDGVTGLHLGWVTLATVANTSAWLTEVGDRTWESSAETWGIVMIAAVTLIGVALAWASRWRIAPALALGWGLSWVAVGRLVGDPHSTVIGIGAIVAAVAILAVTIGGFAFRHSTEVRNAGA